MIQSAMFLHKNLVKNFFVFIFDIFRILLRSAFQCFGQFFMQFFGQWNFIMPTPSDTSVS